MTFVIKSELRASAGAFGSYHPDGWHPKLSVTLLGPVPSAAELVCTFARPNGSPWFEHRVPAPVLADRQHDAVGLELWQQGVDLDEAGTVAFTLRLVSALDGFDELLHDGRMTVVQLPGEHRFAVDNDWMLGRSVLSLDTADEPDAPRLRVRMFVAGEVDVWQLAAYCFRDGVRLAEGAVETAETFTANDGQPSGQEFVITFDGVRGWNNLTASGWGGKWHLLDECDGIYEMRLVQAQRVVGQMAFEVSEGRVVAPGVVEPDTGCGVAIVVAGAGTGAGSGADGSDCYGDPVTAAATACVDDAYGLRRRPANVGADGRAALGDDDAAHLQAYVDRAERLLQTWESELAAAPPHDFGQLLAAEAVGRERAGHDELAAAIAPLHDSLSVLLAGVPIGLGELRARCAALFPAAETRLAGSQQSEADELAPFRALLRGDRLAVFDDHPADSFVYTTLDRHIIETPEELAAAEYWFFEGPLEIPSSARVDGVQITGSVQGWRVLGWRFDASGAVLDEFEIQGLGGSAPKSAFRPPA